MQIVALVRETTDEEEIAEMEKLAKNGGITSMCFYPIRDQHYDEGFVSGELVLLDADTGELLVKTSINLSKPVVKDFSPAIKR